MFGWFFFYLSNPTKTIVAELLPENRQNLPRTATFTFYIGQMKMSNSLPPQYQAAFLANDTTEIEWIQLQNSLWCSLLTRQLLFQTSKKFLSIGDF